MTREIKLTVNDEAISLDYFVQAFIDHTTNGMLSALEGTGEVKTAEIRMDGEEIEIVVNNAPVEVNAFVAKILRNTIKGMISPLKGVSSIKKLYLHVKR